MDDMHQTGTVITVGEDLYGLSVAEITDRIALMRDEISRLERELTKKQKDLSDAQHLFGSPK